MYFKIVFVFQDPDDSRLLEDCCSAAEICCLQTISRCSTLIIVQLQYSTLQYITLQYITVQYIIVLGFPVKENFCEKMRTFLLVFRKLSRNFTFFRENENSSSAVQKCQSKVYEKPIAPSLYSISPCLYQYLLR